MIYLHISYRVKVKTVLRTFGYFLVSHRKSAGTPMMAAQSNEIGRLVVRQVREYYDFMQCLRAVSSGRILQRLILSLSRD